MCFPALVAALPSLSTAFQAIGAVVSTVSSIQQAQAAQDQANYNAAVAENNAKIAEYQAQDAQQRGELEAQRVQREAAQVRGAQRATLAARGLSLGEGTPLSLLEQTEYFGAVDVATARTNAAKEAWANRMQKTNFETEAMSQRATANSINPLMAGASTLLSSAGKVADKWYNMNTPSMGWGSTNASAGSGWGSTYA